MLRKASVCYCLAVTFAHLLNQRMRCLSVNACHVLSQLFQSMVCLHTGGA